VLSTTKAASKKSMWKKGSIHVEITTTDRMGVQNYDDANTKEYAI